MAQITEIAFELNPDEIMSGLKSDTLLLEPRSPGAHQSDIIRDLNNTVLKPGERRPDSEMSEEEMATLNRYREMGMLWEIALEAIFKQRRVQDLDPTRYLRQMEVERNGIYRTTDAIHIPDWRVMEYKLTYRSAKRAQVDRIEVEMWEYCTQLKSNCFAHETRLASLFIFFVNGTYSPPVPLTKRFDFIFEDQELIDNETMLVNHKALMEKEGRATWQTKDTPSAGRRKRKRRSK